jgi:sterol desaturase/sphingolipid hydroxylase (fatty acid hydroxylase superfamily)
VTRSIVRAVFVPAMVFVAAAGAGLAAAEAPRGAIVVVLGAAVGLSFVAERLAPYERRWNDNLDDRWRDVAHAVVNEGTVLVSLLLLPTLVDAIGVEGAWPADWPFALQVVGAVLVADAGITLAHWASHRSSWLWRLHAVHHSVRRMYGFNGLMKHPAHQAIELTAGVTPLVLLGIPATAATALGVCVAVQLLLQHSNVDYATGGLDRLFAWNRPHRFHHLAAAGEGDVNFGLFTTVWDRWLLHTAVDDPRRIGPGDLGVAGRPDYPVRWTAQMAEPFRAT